MRSCKLIIIIVLLMFGNCQTPTNSLQNSIPQIFAASKFLLSTNREKTLIAQKDQPFINAQSINNYWNKQEGININDFQLGVALLGQRTFSLKSTT